MLDLSDLDRQDASLIQRGLASLGLYSGTFRGLPGPLTKAAYEKYISGAKINGDRAARFRRELVRWCLEEEAKNIREVGGNNRGERIDWYEGATWLDPSKDWAWCASFVCRAIWETLKRTGIQPEWTRPRTPGAYAFRDQWARDNKERGIKTVKMPGKIIAGDLVVFRFSHIGVAVGDSDGEWVETVEGNTGNGGGRDGDGLFKKRREVSLISAAIRFERC